jgi:hypothetical protein
MSFINFLSITKNRDVFFRFARRAYYNPELVGILVVMTIHFSISPTSLALINNINYYQDTEDEILF